MATTVKHALCTDAYWVANQTEMEAIYGAGGYYTTINDWAAANAKDLVAADEVLRLEIIGELWSAGSPLTIPQTELGNRFTTNATNRLEIVVVSGTHKGFQYGSGFIAQCTGAYGLVVRGKNLYVEGFELVSAGTYLVYEAGNTVAHNMLISGTHSFGYTTNSIYKDLKSTTGLGGNLGGQLTNVTIVAKGAEGGFLGSIISRNNLCTNVIIYKDAYVGPYTSFYGASGDYNATNLDSDSGVPGANSVTTLTTDDFMDFDNHDYRLKPSSDLVYLGENGTFMGAAIGPDVDLNEYKLRAKKTLPNTLPDEANALVDLPIVLKTVDFPDEFLNGGEGSLREGAPDLRITSDAAGLNRLPVDVVKVTTGHALQFDGVDDHVTTDIPQSSTNAYFEFKVSFNQTPTDSWLRLCASIDVTDSNNRILISRTGGEVRYYKSGSMVSWAGLDYDLVSGYVTFKIHNNGADKELFINGVSQGVRTAATSLLFSVAVLGANFSIHSNHSIQFFKLVDLDTPSNSRTYDARTTSAGQELVETTGNGTNGTLVGFTISPWTGTGLQFDGVNDYVNCGAARNMWYDYDMDIDFIHRASGSSQGLVGEDGSWQSSIVIHSAGTSIIWRGHSGSGIPFTLISPLVDGQRYRIRISSVGDAKYLTDWNGAVLAESSISSTADFNFSDLGTAGAGTYPFYGTLIEFDLTRTDGVGGATYDRHYDFNLLTGTEVAEAAGNGTTAILTNFANTANVANIHWLDRRHAEVHTKIPLAYADVPLYLWSGHATAEMPSVGYAYGRNAVWSEFSAVWLGSDIADRTGGGRDLTLDAGIVQGVDYLEYDGASRATFTEISMTSGRLRVKLTPDITSNNIFLGSQSTTNNWVGFYQNLATRFSGISVNITYAESAGVTYYVEVALIAGNRTVTLRDSSGVSLDTNTAASAATGDFSQFGKYTAATSDFNYDGKIYNALFDPLDRSTVWIDAEYDNQSSVTQWGVTSAPEPVLISRVLPKSMHPDFMYPGVKPVGEVELDPTHKFYEGANTGVLGLFRPGDEFWGWSQSHASTVQRFNADHLYLHADHAGGVDDRLFTPMQRSAKFTPKTTVFVVNLEDYGSGQSNLITNSSSSGWGHDFIITNNTTLRIGYNTANGFSYYSDLTFNAYDGPHTFVVSTDPINKRISIAIDGKSYEPNTGLLSHLGGGTQAEYLTSFIGTTSYTNYYHVKGKLYLLATSDVYLSKAQAESLSADPYQILKPAQQVPVYYPTATPVLLEGSGSVTGTGDHGASAAGHTGVAERYVNGSGAHAAAAVTHTGTGNAGGQHTGTGVHTASTALLSGAGERAITGTAAHAAAATAHTGVAERTVNGSGANAAAAVTHAGVGAKVYTGAGAHAAATATHAGAGDRGIVGTAAHAADPTSHNGTGAVLRLVVGSGAHAAAAATHEGIGSVGGAIAGSGAHAAGPTSHTGTGTVLRLVVGTGAHAAAAVTHTGTGTNTLAAVTGSGAHAANIATHTGTGKHGMLGSGAQQASPATHLAVAERIVVGTGTHAANAPVHLGVVERVITGDGSHSAATATQNGSGVGDTIIYGVGAHIAARATQTGVADRVTLGTGTHAAARVTQTGIALRVITGTGALVASPATHFGADFPWGYAGPTQSFTLNAHWGEDTLKAQSEPLTLVG